MTLTVLFPRTRPIAGTICHVRKSAWLGPTIWKRTHPSRSKSGSVISQQRCIDNLSLAASAVRKWVRRSGHGCSDKESGNPYARRAAVTVSLTCGNSNYGADRNTPVSAPFTKLRTWPSGQTFSRRAANATVRLWLVDLLLWV